MIANWYGANIMVVGICIIQLYLPENQSLKGKRQVLNSIKAQVRNRFDVSIAEVGNTELWQRATLAIAYINQDKLQVDSLFPKIVSFVENLHKAQLLDYTCELIPFSIEE